MSQQITNQDPGQWPSVNTAVAALVKRLVNEAASLRLGVSKGPKGCTLVDCGIEHRGVLFRCGNGHGGKARENRGLT